jgi:diguanylate cyclase (GGDEF)-like protein
VPPGRTRRAAPFLLAGALATAVLFALPHRAVGAAHLAALLALGAAIVGAVWLVPWARLPRSAQMIPPLLSVVAIFLVRDALGGPQSGVAFLYLLPVVWSGLYGVRGEVWIVSALVFTGLLVPFANSGQPEYSGPGEATRVLTFLIVGGIVAWALRRARHGEMSDALTGLPNRRAWREALDHEVHRRRRTGRPFCLVMIDLDNFKQLNDTQGHPAGDHHLRRCAAAWRAELRRIDILARVGGEEFAVLLPEIEVAGARAALARMAAVMPAGETFSAGLVAATDGADAEDLHRAADQALYAAKAAGRDRLVEGAVTAQAARATP